MVCMEHAKGEDVKKTLSHTIGPQNSIGFPKHAAAICSDITILNYIKNSVEVVKHSLNKT